MLHALAALCVTQADYDRRALPSDLPPLQRLVESALDHDVMGLVAVALLAGYAGALTDDLREALEIYLEGIRIEARRAETQLAEILRIFAERGIPAMPFKGPLLAHTAYADTGIRRFLDLDLMIHPDDVGPALDCLGEAGFVHQGDLDGDGVAAIRRYAGEYIMFRKGGLPVEPHWLPAPWTMAFDIDVEAIWRRAKPAWFLGAACYLPAPEDHFFLLALHGAKERWHKLKWIADIAAFHGNLPGLDVAALRAAATAQGCRRAVDLALLLSHRLFAVPAVVPPADSDTWRLADTVLARLAVTTDRPLGPYTVTHFQWRLRERLRDRVRYAARTLFTPRVAHYQRLRLPPSLRWLHVPLKLPWDHILTPSLHLARRLVRR